MENKFEPNKGNDIDKTETSNHVSSNKVVYDDLLTAAGELGRYQIILCISTAPFYFFGVFVYYSQMFMSEVSPNHWCWIPELQNLTEIERRKLAIPSDNNSRFGYAQCYAYEANWSRVLETGLTPNSSWNKVPCQNGWEFNRSEIPYPTISSELGWVCDRDSYQATAQSLFFLGSIIGGFIIGWISDRFGRLPATVISCIIGCIGGVISTFARNLIEFASCRFLMGIAYDNCMIMPYLIVLEYISPKYRSLFANMSFAVYYSAMVTLLPWIALACGHWKVISLVTSLPLALGVFAPLILPESPRWLLSKGRVDDAIKKAVTIGRINKKEITPKLIEQFKSSMTEAHEQKESLLEIFKRPILKRSFILICILFMCCVIVFDGLVRSVGQIDFDYFVTFSLVSFTEFPSLLLLSFIMDWLGRRWLTVIAMAISGLFSLLTVFVGSGIQSVIYAVIARFAVNMSYNTAMQWAAEILPTSVRGAGVSIVHICGYIATVISPYIVYLNTILYELPLIIIGVIAWFSVLIAIFLPETAKRDMPQTFDDAEEIFRAQKFWQLPKKKETKSFAMEVNQGFEM
ncbi:hypothetical protein K1T71_005786 [Dendrolimus kikuchii]|uniref:Uncharacterized protein n=1 Tax=Dendrolimus kikuchii TaxID=765133 RepID=A0ACC1D4X6_9NEOP|nr:hypothetical protein K1T71_005786 [Dendrolimus kikuchii]